MHADEQVGTNALCLLHPFLQRHEEVGIPRQVGAHGVARHPRRVDAVPQLVGNLQHHIFFLRAAGADGTRVFTAMTGVDGNDDQPFGGRRLGRRGRGRLGGRGRRRDGPGGRFAGLLLALGNQRADRIVGRQAAVLGRRLQSEQARCTGTGFVQFLQALADQLIQRIGCLARVQIQHQPVLVGRHRLQVEDLRFDSLFEVDRQRDAALATLGHANARDVGVVRLELPHQLMQAGVQLGARDFHRQLRG